MRKNQNDSFFCAHYISMYLPLTENWIYKILINHTVFTPLLLSRKKINLSLFPIAHHHNLEDFNVFRQYVEIIFFKLIGYFRFFKILCRSNNVRILHVHFGYHGVKMIGLKKKLNIPLVCSFYGDDAFAFKHENKYTNLFKEADMILVLGIYMRARLIQLGCPATKIRVHHLGIDTHALKFVKRTIMPGSRVRFLIASSFVQKKGIDLTIKALSKFKNHYDFSLDIIGDGPLKNEILSVIETEGMKEYVTLHGYKPYDYFINLAYQCEVFIQASRTTADNNKEGTPMAIVDAMATGMMVVSTKHSDIPEIVLDGETGYLAEENNQGSLEECLQKTFDNISNIAAFSLKGRAWIEKEFDAEKQTHKLEEYYKDLVNV